MPSECYSDVGRGITLCYETFGEEEHPPVLVVMGWAAQMIAWPEEFCRRLAERGFYVVRFDNRDSGRSTHLGGAPLSMRDILLRPRQVAPYDLADMAEDTLALLRSLRLTPAHVVGASMGGMIAQIMAARSPGEVRSLVSIMSRPGSFWSGRPQLRVLPLFLRRAPKDRESYIRFIEDFLGQVGSVGVHTDQDALDHQRLAGESFDRGIDPPGSLRQLAAIMASGNRTRQVRTITTPTLVIHGTTDSLIAPSGGRATARAIGGARLLKISQMGHDLARAHWDEIIDAIASHVEAVERGA